MTHPTQDKQGRNFDVWRVHYETYAEVLTMGEKQQECVARRLPFDEAKKLCAELGFGYCIKESKQ